jgi:hypothetical protein
MAEKQAMRLDSGFERTPREEMLAAMAEKNRAITPKTYDITNKNPHAMRVVHDFYNDAVCIEPGETKHGVTLQPHAATALGKSDLKLVATS